MASLWSKLSGGRMFQILDSDSEESSSSSTDSEDNEREERLQHLKLPIVIPPSLAGPEIGRNATDDDKVDGEKDLTTGGGEEDSGDGLFLIDSSGGAGKMTLKGHKAPEDKDVIHTPLDPGLDLTQKLYIDLECLKLKRAPRSNKIVHHHSQEKEGINNASSCSKMSDAITEMMKKATFKASSSEKNPSSPVVSRQEMKRRRRAEREKTKGSQWFHLPATELTEERRRDLEVMQLRDVIDPKSRYKKDDRTVLPKYFQVGTIVEDPSDYYSSRIPRKERKQTIVDELLADAELQRRNKRKYTEIVQERRKYDDTKMKHKKKPHRDNNDDNDFGETKMKTKTNKKNKKAKSG